GPVEKGWVIGFLGVVLIPQTRFSDALSVGPMAEPVLRGWIESRFVVVAQEGNRVSFDVATPALRPSLILNRRPQKGHVTDDAANFALQRKFAVPHCPFGRVAVPPCREFQPVAPDQRRANDEPKDRASVIATAGAGLPFVLRQAGAEILCRPPPPRGRFTPDHA